jgi:hypothetical protein
MMGQKRGSRKFFANRELIISTSATRQECKTQLMDLIGPVKVFKKALVPIVDRTQNWNHLKLGWIRLPFLKQGRTPR